MAQEFMRLLIPIEETEGSGIPLFAPPKPFDLEAAKRRQEKSQWARAGREHAARAAAKAMDRAASLPREGWPWSLVTIEGKEWAFSAQGWMLPYPPSLSLLEAAIHRRDGDLRLDLLDSIGER